MNLVKRSIEIILKGQSNTGAYIACPNFKSYQYSWFRDGAFIAYAMDRVGEAESANLFHSWVFTTLSKKQDVMRRVVEKRAQHQTLQMQDYLHTRYTMKGKTGGEEWPNHQLDGFGTWLWALVEHQKEIRQDLPQKWRPTMINLANYLISLWDQPCYDCWEEFPDSIHPYTLASIYAGLTACQTLTGVDYSKTLKAIKQLVYQQAAPQGYFVKSIGSDLVDSSLLGLSIPYDLVDHDDPRMLATKSRIEADLYHGAGVKRYAQDTYYGGGDWVLLAAWKGWYDVLNGEHQKAENVRAWIESAANLSGQLPEQVPLTLNEPSYYQYWVERWGEIATPLLWSHAMYLILMNALGEC